MKRVVITLVILSVLGFAVWRWNQPTPISVQVQQVRMGRVEASVANTRVGTVKACRRARMSPPSSGQVALLYVLEGDRVRAGDVLLEIWNDDKQAELTLAEVEIDAARSRAEQACAVAGGARREANRATKLRRDRVLSEEAADKAATEALSGEAACVAAGASAQVAVRRAEVARHALEKTVLRAPFGGVIAEVNAKLGEYLTPSPPGIATAPAVDLIDPDCLYVSAPIDEVDAPQIAVGMPVCVTMDAFPTKQCEARVRRIAPYVQDAVKQARTVEVEVSVPAVVSGRTLLPGYSADIEILIEVRENVLRIPTESVLEGSRVFVLNADDGLLDERTVAIGLTNWAFTEVRSGLSQGERVVTSVGRVGVEAGARAVAEQ
ncbi:MAG: HlyD family secretion protein [Gammaproteobacteria bacterium]|jgi:HlyD family secretion protein